ncbi:MAG: class I SAM-dependent rRNA methyltransferase [Chloroflexi bacterium]|jgi:23S rRNA (cytosine1962-C5)-methyltransferase|nr:class I SAM-dependent rRNA methyltransferase [Chloroflexota bacterium]MBT3669911.1 class I SAM-dependent rRNA methyltransferase [Chloroflexota bacterium]MBT4001797.1 class I SAM-dependent rRNA methyltransferase [Chloroflexota bacterium]MBT4304813.1 class I SAM-dependent rRNA methyltransferase [Chloroflexota bacterium]MBT4534686.1 class I SAM-dependent rRNA methyltransferase [Chloroflexota bacterium]
MNENLVIKLKPGREKSLLRKHPWIFSGAIDHFQGNPSIGETVKIESSTGEFLAWAAFSPESQITGRVWSWKQSIPMSPELLKDRIMESIDSRTGLINSGITNAFRLVNGESDGLPGLIVDQYADVLVVQILSAGSEYWKDEITQFLVEISGITQIYERSDVEVRKLEGLEPRVGILAGKEIPDQVEIFENGIKYLVGVKEGQKTGFYLDQRSNRLAIREYAKEKEVLDCFSFSGGFTLSAIKGGAKKVTSIDSSGNALKIIEQNLKINDFDPSIVELIEEDVFSQLRTFRDSRRSFDLIILDPPKFAPTKKQLEKATRGYKDINLLAFKLLNPGGTLFTFSCSGGMDTALFQKVVAGAALDAKVEAKIISRMGQDVDHPVSLSFPEGTYLKGLTCQIK